MSKLIPVSSDDECKVCGRKKGFCKTKIDENILYHLCSQEIDAIIGDRIDDYICVGNGGNGWSTFVHHEDSRKPNAQRTKEEIVSRLLSEEKVSAENKAVKRQQVDSLSLSVDERDAGYRRILASLELCDEDKQDLLNRGYTKEQIEQCGFKSYEYKQIFEEWSPLYVGITSFAVDPRLPGVSLDGRSFRVGGGILIPIQDTQGRIVALQLRLRQPLNGSRYLWLSGGIDQILKLSGFNENPLAILRPNETALGFGLCEGTGAKPFLTSQRLNLNVIGASGGQFLSSPKLLQQYLEELQAESGLPKKITLFPDAGDIGNEQIVNRWMKTAEMLQLWGWKVTIAWWEQVTKEDNDIDELSSEYYEKIVHLDPKKFNQLSRRIKGQKLAEEKKLEDELQLAVENKIYKELTELNELKLKELDVEIIRINQQWLTPESLHLKKGEISLVLSYKGSRKSEASAIALVTFDNLISLHTRISLALQTATNLTEKRIQAGKAPVIAKNSLTENSPINLITTCSNSLCQFHPSLISQNGALLLDEMDQVFSYHFESLCNSDGGRPLILSALVAQIASALGDGCVLGMSADISMKEIEYVRKIAPIGVKIKIIINEYQPQRGKMHFSTAKTADSLIDELLKKLDADIPCFAVDDIKGGIRGCRNIAEYVRKYYESQGKTIRVLEINADTSGDEEVRRVLDNINKLSLDYDLIICSPSITSGVSITNGRFIHGNFGFFNGILDDNQASQSVIRVRGALESYCWAAEKGFNFEFSKCITPAEVDAFYRQNYKNRNRFLLKFKPEYCPMTKEWESPHWDLFCQNAAYQNLVMRRLRYRIKNKFIADGLEIIEQDFGESKGTEEALKGCWWNLQEGDAIRVQSAELIDELQVDVLKEKQKKQPLTIEEKIQLVKYYLHRTFGDKLIASAEYTHKNGNKLTGYAAMCLLNWDRKLENGLFNFDRIFRPIGDSIDYDISAENSQLKHGQAIQRFPADTRNKTRLFQFVEAFNVQQFLRPEYEFYLDEYKEFTQKIKAHHEATKQVLGFDPQKIGNTQIFTEVLQRFGLSVESCDVVLNGIKQKWQSRKITLESWNRAQLFVEYRQQLRLEREAQEVEKQKQQEQKSQEEADRQLTATIAKTKDSIRQKFEKYTYQDCQLFTTESLKDCVEILNDCDDRETLEGIIIGWRSLFRTKEKVNDFVQLLAENFLKEKTLQFALWLTPTERQMNLFEEGEEVYELASDETIEFIDAQIGKLPSNQEELWTRRIDAACKIGVDIGLQCFHKAENFYQSIAKSLPAGSSWKVLFNKIVMGITQESTIILSE